MIFSYPRSEVARSTAWYRLLRNRPTYEQGDFKFAPMEHHFRKEHGADTWGWYVDKWRFQGNEILAEAPCEPPPSIAVGRWVYPYEWSVWTEHDGTPACGFVVGNFWLPEPQPDP